MFSVWVHAEYGQRGFNKLCQQSNWNRKRYKQNDILTVWNITDVPRAKLQLPKHKIYGLIPLKQKIDALVKIPFTPRILIGALLVECPVLNSPLKLWGAVRRWICHKNFINYLVLKLAWNTWYKIPFMEFDAATAISIAS